MRILLIGGTGLISSAVAQAAVARGDDVTIITRGSSPIDPAVGVHTLRADARDPQSLRNALHGQRLRGETFDAVIQFVAYEPEQVAQDAETFARLTSQYVLISTAAAYRVPDRLEHRTEDTPRDNPWWPYAQLKERAEEVLREEAERHGLPWTVIRPAHTYGDSKIPGYVGNSSKPWTLVDRLRRGADIVIPGDGTSLWTITHATDLAAGILALLGHPLALGRAVHITSDEALTWETIYRDVARAAGVSDEQFEEQVVHVPTDAIVRAFDGSGPQLYGDKMAHAVYDTSLMRSLAPDWTCRVPFAEGAARAVEWFEARPDLQQVDAEANARFDHLAEIYRAALGNAALD